MRYVHTRKRARGAAWRTQACGLHWRHFPQPRRNIDSFRTRGIYARLLPTELTGKSTLRFPDYDYDNHQPRCCFTVRLWRWYWWWRLIDDVDELLAAIKSRLAMTRSPAATFVQMGTDRNA